MIPALKRAGEICGEKQAVQNATLPSCELVNASIRPMTDWLLGVVFDFVGLTSVMGAMALLPHNHTRQIALGWVDLIRWV